MDFGFVHGPSKVKGRLTFAGFMRLLISFTRPPRRPAITLIDGQKLDNRPVASLHNCIEYLRGTVTPPIGNLILGSHANDMIVGMPMFDGQGRATDFEILQETQSSPSKSINVTDLIGPPTTPPTHAVRIFGCNIGKANKFLIEYKKALGNQVKVIAPKHFDGLSREGGYGVWEYLCYEFVVRAPALPKKAKRTLSQIMALFQGRVAENPQAFKFKSGNNVPADYWTTRDWYLPDPVEDRLMNMQGIAIGPRTNVLVRRGLDTAINRFIWGVPIPNPNNVPDPNNKVACLAALSAELIIDRQYPNKSRFVGGPGGHDFPFFERLGYADLPKMLDGYSWTFSKVPGGLQCVGERETYTLIVPVTDPDPSPAINVGNVLTNFYPDPDKFNKVPIDQLPPDALDLNDTSLYETV